VSLASHLLSSLALARRRWYGSHPAARKRLTRPVISVGNLSVGGTGKTPVVMTIARLLIEMGERPAILSRGYKRQRQSDGVVVVSDGVSLRSDVARAGDEPFMMALSLPQTIVLVSSDRYLAGRLAETQLDCTVHVLDDGFQHLGLMRDIDLLIVSDDDVGNPHMLPRGRLREPLAAAAAADALLVSSADALGSNQAAAVFEVPHSFRFDRMIDLPRLFQRPHAGRSDELAPVLRPGPVFAMAGIAKPQRFFDDLRHAGWSLAGTRTFGDHHRFSGREIAGIARAAQSAGAKAIVMTEKDMVRVWALGAQSLQPEAQSLPWAWVPLRVTLESSFVPWLQDGLARARAAERSEVLPPSRKASAARSKEMRQRLEYLLVRLVAVTMQPLPPGAVRAFGTMLGLSFFYADRQHRRIAQRNLQAAFPHKSDAERLGIARAMFGHFGHVLVELLKFSSLSPERMLELVEWEGEDRVELAYSHGRGVLFCTGHFGFWEQHALAHGLRFGPMAVLARALDNPRLNTLLERTRGVTGNSVIYRQGAMRRAMRLLAAGQGVGMLIDQHMQSPDALCVDFFERPASTTSTLARLALRTRAPVVPLFALPLPGGRYRMIYEHPVEPPREDTPDAVREFTQRCTDVLEMYVRRHPELWLWMHRRWRDAGAEQVPGMFPSASQDLGADA